MKWSTCLVLIAVLTVSVLAAADEALEIVEPEFVCMVSDAVYDKEQVRVDVDEKTYYGCCDMCKARLAKNENLRKAVDPVSGKEVDKATAIIAADSYRRVYYFENKENVEKANEKLAEKNQ